VNEMWEEREKSSACKMVAGRPLGGGFIYASGEEFVEVWTSPVRLLCSFLVSPDG
jgi:hypothetical protein